MHTIWGPLSDEFLCILHYMVVPSDQFLRLPYYMGAPPPRSVYSLLCGGPLRSVSLLTNWGPLRSDSLHTMGDRPLDQFSLTIWGPLRSDFSLTICPPPPQISFFAYYVGPPGRFHRILHGGPSDHFLRLLYIGTPSDLFLRILYGGPSGQFLHLL